MFEIKSVFGAVCGLVVGAAVLGGLSPAHAAGGTVTFSGGTCTDRNRCIQHLLCPRGYQLSGTSAAAYCTAETAQQPTRPVCGRESGRSDWTWNASALRCERTRVTGRVITSTANIECGPGRQYIQGQCHTPRYSQPSLADIAGLSRDFRRSVSASSVTVRPRCASGFQLQAITRTAFVCVASAGTTTVRPSCNKYAGFSYTWNGNNCARTRGSGKVIERAGLAYCQSGYRLSGRACVRDGYAKPRL